MNWKIRSPRQFAPLGNLSAVYYYILHSQSAIASDGPREKLGSQLVSSEKLCQTPSCFISDLVSWLICAEQSCRHGQSPIGLDVDRFSWNSGGATLLVGVVWGFLVQLQFKWPLFTELVGFGFTEETCCSKLIHATIPRSLPLPQVFQAIQLEISPRTKSGQQRIPGTKAYSHPCYL